MQTKSTRNMRNLLFFVIVLFLLPGCSANQKSLTFVHLTDIHVAPGASSAADLKRVVSEINELGPDFVVVTGDLTNNAKNAELEAAKSILDSLDVPYYAIPGNHETNWSESAGLKFNELWGNDRFLFTKKQFMFVGFNTGPYMKMGDGHVKKEDLQWLKRVLEEEKREDQMLIAMAHYPLAEGLANWTEVTKVLKEYDCKMAFCGHEHNVKLMNFDGIPGSMGRSTIKGGHEVPGYTIVKFSNDSALVYEKEVGARDRELHFAIDLLSPDTLNHIEVSPRPDYSVNESGPTQQVLFDFRDSASIFAGPCIVNDSVLVYGNSLGQVKGLKIPSKEVIWENEYEGALFSTPVSDGEVIAFGTVEGTIVGVDAKDGAEVWTVNAGTPVLAEGVVKDDALFIGGGQSAFFKINMSDGEVAWKFDGIEGLVQGVPALGEDEVVFGAWDRHLYSVDRKTGALNWKWNNGRSGKLLSPGNIAPAIANDKVFLVAPDRFMTALDRKTGQEVWRTDKHQVRESMGVGPDGEQVFAKLMNDSIIAMSARSNKPETLWAIDAGIGYDHNPCPIATNEEMVVAGTKNGLVVAVSPDGEEVLWQYKAGNSSINELIVQPSGSIWMTLMEGRLLQIKPNI